MSTQMPSLERPGPLGATSTSLAVALLFALFVTTGCHVAIPSVDATAGADRLDLAERAELELGRAEYIAKCSGCHALYAPSRGGSDYWRHWTERMAEPASLGTDSRRRILAYLWRAAAVPPR